ncbi:MAG: divalent cation tolerance protein CutA, partial [bacterium]
MNIVIFITSASMKEANKIAYALVEAKLVACVNIINKIESVFFWDKKTENAKEVL